MDHFARETKNVLTTKKLDEAFGCINWSRRYLIIFYAFTL